MEFRPKKKYTVEELIEAGKQVGSTIDSIEAGKIYYNSAAIQKWQGSYRVNLFKVAYDNMDESEVDETLEFRSLSEAFGHVEENSPIVIASMGTLKGQKLFDPEFLYSNDSRINMLLTHFDR